MGETEPSTPEHQTVGHLITMLKAYPPNARLVIVLGYEDAELNQLDITYQPAIKRLDGTIIKTPTVILHD